MSNKIESFRVTPANDKRRKLSDEERQSIILLHKEAHLPIREIARRYPNVSRRTIQFILFPERDQLLKQRVKQERRWLKYYTTEKHKLNMRAHRKHKRELLNLPPSKLDLSTSLS